MRDKGDAFLLAVIQNTRKYYWTGGSLPRSARCMIFDQNDIVKGSGYITSQCCGFTEIELGTVSAAEMGISLFSDIDRYTLEDAAVTLAYHLQLADTAVFSRDYKLAESCTKTLGLSRQNFRLPIDMVGFCMIY